MPSDQGGFSRLPKDPEQRARRSRADLQRSIVGTTHVVGLGAICDLGSTSSDGRSQTFSISEFALLDDGRRVILHSERGYGIGWGSNIVPPSHLAAHDTRETITQQVLTAVQPDEDNTTDDHPWQWLAQLAQVRGLNVSKEDLRNLPYEVVLDESVIQWLDSGKQVP